jgi:tRNA dimethylallyltransferase
MGEKIQQNDIVFITGPTASGKTQAGIELALAVNGEIISADSMQVYRHMNIGTAKPTLEERRGIKHHLIDILDPDEACSAALFKKMAEKAVTEIQCQGKVPIIVGGSGFYLNALLYDVAFEENFSRPLQDAFIALAAEHGSYYLHERLRKYDPESAALIHPNNVKRVARAMAFFEQTGKTLSEHNRNEQARQKRENAKVYIMYLERLELYAAINNRCDEMFNNGLVAEVEWLLTNSYNENLVSMSGIGYKETVDYLKNRCPLEEAIARVKQETRRFAKRQLTWLRHRCDGNWVTGSEFINNIV